MLWGVRTSALFVASNDLGQCKTRLSFTPLCRPQNSLRSFRLVLAEGTVWFLLGRQDVLLFVDLSDEGCEQQSVDEQSELVTVTCFV